MENGFDIGLNGLDTLGGALAGCMAASDFSLGVCLDAASGPAEELPCDRLKIFPSLSELVRVLNRPRVFVLRVAPGVRLQSAFAEVLRLLESGDVIIDASDSWFKDTSRRAQAAAAKGIQFIALGLAVNENSPIPLLMPGGRADIFENVRSFLETATLSSGSHSISSLGLGPAGHFIKMAHAAIETAVGEIVREGQALLERGLGAEAGDFLRVKRDDPLFDYLHSKVVPPSGPSLELARWAVCSGRELSLPTFTLEAASGTRSWENREVLSAPFCQPHGRLGADSKGLVAQAHGAISTAMIIAYTEGLALIATASDRFGFQIDLPATVRVWRNGVFLRARLLDEIQGAFQATPGLPNLLFDDDFSGKVMELQEFLRQAVWQADEWNIKTPALAAALRYIDSFRDAWLPINLVQPQNFHWTPRPQRVLRPPLSSEWENDLRSITGPSLA